MPPSHYDIFISYGQLDDQDPAGDVKGWVDLLVERLPRMISANLGYQPKIWRDERSLTGDAPLEKAIEEGIGHSLLLIPIVSPRYVQSDWCRKELEAFCKKPPLPEVPAHRSRVFKVIKSPLLFNLAKKEPDPLRELIGYSFYEMDGEMPVEFSPDMAPKDPRYWSALRRLAWDITTMLVKLKPNSGPLPIPPPPTNGAQKFVYLAETTSDLAQEREHVRDELRQRGYAVVPEEKIPTCELRQTEAAVLTSLSRSVVSVHLIGQRYGSTPEDDARSIVSIQEDLAAQRSAKEPSFKRLLWMPQDVTTHVSDERQKSFITTLQNRVSAGAELLQTSIEDLKTRIIEKLNPPAPFEQKRSRRSRLKQVYLICENGDRPLVKPIREYLFGQNFEVITWLDDEAGGRLMEYHHKNLRDCDAALVYFGNGDEPWVRKNLEDLEKAYGYGREHDWIAKALYVAAPPNVQKDEFLTHLAKPIIRNYKTFDPSDLSEFVTEVQAHEGSQQ